MAPMRPGAGGPAEDPLAEDLTLTSLLGIASPFGLDVPVLWRQRVPRSRLRVPIGTDAEGQPVELDIKESAQGGMGPHGLVIGATGQPLPIGHVMMDLIRWLVFPLAFGQLLRPLLAKFAHRHKRRIQVVDRVTILMLVYTSFCDSVKAVFAWLDATTPHD